MSFNVLVIPEDFRKDQYILGPVLQELVKTFRPRGRVRVCRDPLLRGAGEALKWNRIEEIIERYRMFDCFILAVDRDGIESRRQRLSKLQHPDSKEAYFDPYVRSRALDAAPFGGRLELGAQAPG